MKVRVDVLGEWVEKDEHFFVEIDDADLKGTRLHQFFPQGFIIDQIVMEEFWDRYKNKINYTWSME